jgi:hypothetical protein
MARLRFLKPGEKPKKSRWTYRRWWKIVAILSIFGCISQFVYFYDNGKLLLWMIENLKNL